MKAIARRIFFKSSDVVQRSVRWKNRLLFSWCAGVSLERFSLGSGCSFHAPVRLCGARGVLKIGSGNGFGYYPAPRVGDGSLLIQPRKREAEIIIGDRNWFSNNVTMIANERIVIGDRCRIGDDVSFFDCDFHEMDPAHRGRSHGPTAPVRIGDNVWIGSGVRVLKGVTIGENSVIGAMSLVCKSIPANCIAAGNPARVLSQL